MSNATMVCPDVGEWRAWLDQQADSQPALAEHLAACALCRAKVTDLRGSAELAAATLAPLAPDRLPSAAEVALAHTRLLQRQRGDGGEVAASSSAAPERGRLLSLSLARKRVVAMGGLAAVLALSFVVGFTPQGQAAAAQFLAQFRSQKFAVVSLSTDPAQYAAFEQLEHLGTITSRPDPSLKAAEAVKSVAEASARVGFPVKQPDASALPASANQTPEVHVMPASEFRFTFDKDKARAYFQSIGRSDVRLPDKFHGASLVVNLPAGVILDYSWRRPVSAPGPKGAPAGAAGQNVVLLIGQAGELTAGVDGNVTLDELREFLLGLPGLPPETVRQLRAIQDWRTTLPIPIPADLVQWRETTISGGPGLLLSESTGLGSAVLWQRDGRVYGVASTLPSTDVKRVAESLK